MEQSMSRLLAHERIRTARHHLERTQEITLARQATLSAIPAPTGAESRRGACIAALFREVGLREVVVDEVGNVRGRAGGSGAASAPAVLAAHLDTAFGPEVDVAVARRGARLEGPGGSDNDRGLAAVGAVAESGGEARGAARPAIPGAATGGGDGSWQP